MAVFGMVRAPWRRLRPLVRLTRRSRRQVVVVDVDVRVEVLKFASGFTSEPTSSLLTAENARPLLAWVSEAKTPEDLKARVCALRQHHLNSAGDEENEAVVDNPAEFLKGVDVLYRFLAGTADAEADEILDTGDDKFQDDDRLHAWMDGDGSA